MQRLPLIKTLSLATVLVALIHFSYPLLVGDNNAIRIEAASDRLDFTQDSAAQLERGCAGPDPVHLGSCQDLERQILASTVRIEIDAWVRESIETRGVQLSSYRLNTI